MSFVTKVNQGLKRVKQGLKDAADRQVAAAEAKAQRKIAAAKTETERLRAKTALRRKKERTYKDLHEAQQAASRAATDLKKARVEAGDLTATERLQRAFQGGVKRMQSLQGRPAPVRRTPARRRTEPLRPARKPKRATARSRPRTTKPRQPSIKKLLWG
ncbi:MAG: hypothetical protein JRN35_06050 [Nitrososphaerota archaeon]|nr:hypothetical protein [Nitrososphaerota archaeon]